MQVEGSVMIVTGASSGIGEATARLAAKEGARLLLAARRTDRLEALAAELPDALPLTIDVRRPDQVREMVDQAVAIFGRVDVLVNNAGQGYHVPIEQVSLEDFHAVMELNVYGALVAMQAVIPVMRSQGAGAIVNVSSGTVLGLPPGVGPYSATKAAITALSKVARKELAGDGITVSTVFPYITSTEFHRALRNGPGWRPPADRGDWPPADPPEKVAEAILELVRTGDEETRLGPFARPPGDS